MVRLDITKCSQCQQCFTENSYLILKIAVHTTKEQTSKSPAIDVIRLASWLRLVILSLCGLAITPLPSQLLAIQAASAQDHKRGQDDVWPYSIPKTGC